MLRKTKSRLTDITTRFTTPLDDAGEQAGSEWPKSRMDEENDDEENRPISSAAGGGFLQMWKNITEGSHQLLPCVLRSTSTRSVCVEIHINSRCC